MDSWRLEDISVCTAVMNRPLHLIQALKTWLEYPFHEIVIVDWGSKRPVSQLPLVKASPRVKVYRGEADEWIAPMAMGAAVRLTSAPMVFKIDSDVTILTTPPTSPPEPNGFYRGLHRRNKSANPNARSNDTRVYGTWLAPRAYFDAVNGYNERFRGWGMEDNDLYSRMKRAGYNYTPFPMGSLYHIPHDKTIRAKGNLVSNAKVQREQPWTMDDCHFDEGSLHLADNGSTQLKL